MQALTTGKYQNEYEESSIERDVYDAQNGKELIRSGEDIVSFATWKLWD